MFKHGIWRNQDYTRLWAAATASAFGTDITLTAFPFVAILVLDASAWDLGLLRIATMAPAFAVGLIAGAWVDRLPRRPIMMTCDLGRAVLLLTIPLAAWLDLLTFGHLVAIAVLTSIASTFFDIADRSMLPSLVGRDDLVDANRLLTAGNTVSEAAGFAAGGWLVQLLSAPGALVIDAATFLWSALWLRRIERPEAPPTPKEEREPILREIVEGLRLVARQPVLRGIASSLLVMSCSMQVVGTVYLLYVNQELGFSPGVLGLIFASGGLFSLAASLSGHRVTALLGVGPLLIVSLLLVAASQGLTALATGVTTAAVILMVLQQSGDYPWTLFEITQVSTRQAVTADPWQGRMNGSFHAVEFGGYVLGAILGGLLGDVIGLRATIAIGAVGIALAAIPIVLSPVRGLRELPVDE